MIIHENGEPLKLVDFKDEKELQKLIFEEPKLLGEKGEAEIWSIGREVETDAGPIDVLLADANGKLIIVEAKLARNGDSRRKVVAQIIDYVSALSLYSYFELNDATKGKLGELIEKHGQEKTMPKLIEDSMKSGDARLVIAVDSANENLKRIAQFVADHTDFEIDLIEIQKYLQGEKYVYSVNTVLKSEAQFVQKKRSQANAALLSELQQKWNNEYPNYPKVLGTYTTYRQIFIEGWPKSLHYEFTKSARNDAALVRLDNEIVSKDRTKREAVAEAFSKFEGMKIGKYQIQIARGRGSKIYISPEKDDLDELCRLMAELIEKTKATIDKAVAQ